MPLVSISYRRDDIAASTMDTIAALLQAKLGEDAVFYDKHSLHPGENFPDVILQNFSHSRVILIFIGPQWVGSKEDHSRRIDRDKDWVRREVELALELKSSGRTTVLPVLIDDTKMPDWDALPPSMKTLGIAEVFYLRTKGPKEPQNSVRLLVEDIRRIEPSLDPQEPSTAPLPSCPQPSCAWHLMAFGALGVGIVCTAMGIRIFFRDGWPSSVAAIILGAGLLLGALWDLRRCVHWSAKSRGTK